MSVFVHGHSKDSWSYPFRSNSKTGTPQASRSVYLSSFTAIVHVCIPVTNNNNTKASCYVVAKSYFGQLNEETFVSTSIHHYVSKSVSTDMSFTFFFNKSSLIPIFLTNPSSFLLRWQFVAIILLIPRTKCIQVRASGGHLPVLFRPCSDVTASCHGLDTNKITAVS